MSFETTVGFLRDAVLEGEGDSLDNPSARLVVGRVGRQGTGMVDLLMPMRDYSEEDKVDLPMLDFPDIGGADDPLGAWLDLDKQQKS